MQILRQKVTSDRDLLFCRSGGAVLVAPTLTECGQVGKSLCRENRPFVRKNWPTREKNSFYRKKKFQKTDSETLRQKVSLHHDWLSSHLGGAVLKRVTHADPRRFGPILLGKTAFY